MRADGSRRRTRALVPAAAVLLGALTACSAGTTTPPAATAAATTPAPAETTSPTAEPTPDATTPPERPAAMDSPTADGAAAAAAYFLLLYPYAYATGDLAEWDALAASTCEFCASVRDEVTAMHDAGKYSIGSLEIVSGTGLELDKEHWYSARLDILIGKSQDFDEDGSVIDSTDGGDYTVDFAMTWDAGWTIDSVGIVPAE